MKTLYVVEMSFSNGYEQCHSNLGAYLDREEAVRYAQKEINRILSDDLCWEKKEYENFIQNGEENSHYEMTDERQNGYFLMYLNYDYNERHTEIEVTEVKLYE